MASGTAERNTRRHKYSCSTSSRWTLRSSRPIVFRKSEIALPVNRLGEPFGCGRLTAESDHRTNRGAMADKELIIGLLERVRRRVRSERRFKTIYSILSIALIIPLVFKLIDLISPLRGGI